MNLQPCSCGPHDHLLTVPWALYASLVSFAHIKMCPCAGVAFAAKSFLLSASSLMISRSCHSYMLTSMNVLKLLRAYATPLPFSSFEMVKRLMKCSELEKKGCMIVCGCIPNLCAIFSIPEVLEKKGCRVFQVCYVMKVNF